MSNQCASLAISVPPVASEEVGPRDAESQAVGGHPGFQRLIRESRARTAAGERGIAIEDLLKEIETEEAASVTNPPARSTRKGSVAKRPTAARRPVQSSGGRRKKR